MFIALLHVWFERRTDECAMLSNLATCSFEFELDHNATEATINICCVKDERHIWSPYGKQVVQEISLGDRTRSGRSKTLDSPNHRSKNFLTHRTILNTAFKMLRLKTRIFSLTNSLYFIHPSPHIIVVSKLNLPTYLILSSEFNLTWNPKLSFLR